MHVIGEAVRECCQKHGRMPGDNLLSWRVHILPMIGEGELFREFHLNEPWDSPANRKLIERIPPIYALTRDGIRGSIESREFSTCFQAVLGAGTLWETCSLSGRGLPAPPCSAAIIVQVDQTHAVVWTKPADWKYEPGGPLTDLSGHLGDYVIAVTGDGEEVAVPLDLSETARNQLFLPGPAAGAPIPRVRTIPFHEGL